MNPANLGDHALARTVSRALRKRPGAWAAASVRVDGTRMCAHDAGLADDFEIGSVSKALTGMLYVDALGRGEIGPFTRLDECLELDGTPVGAILLAHLSTHTSGLPRLPPGIHPMRRTWALARHGSNPYRESLPELLALARRVRIAAPERESRPAYSNLGFALLGHAVAAAAGMTYAELLRIRLGEPLGLTSTYVPGEATDLHAGAVPGSSRGGRIVEPWINLAIAPAGGVRSSARDLAILLTAVLDGSAPGTAALDPVREFSGKAARIGAGWLTLQTPSGPVTWHNGGTGGHRSWVGVDRERNRGFAVVSANTRSVDNCGFTCLAAPDG